LLAKFNFAVPGTVSKCGMPLYNAGGRLKALISPLLSLFQTNYFEVKKISWSTFFKR